MNKKQDVERRIMARKISLGHQMEQLSRAIGRDDWGMARAYADAVAVVCADISTAIYEQATNAPKSKGGKA